MEGEGGVWVCVCVGGWDAVGVAMASTAKVLQSWLLFGPRWVARNLTKPRVEISVTSCFIHV
jgi:hypothetical protein